MNQVENYLSTLVEKAASYTPTLAGALATLVVGWLLVGLFRKLLTRRLQKQNVDALLQKYIPNLISVVLYIGLGLAVASMFGIKIVSFIAILGSASLAVGLALQGSLSHFAGGVLLLLFRPFRQGDVIEAQGYIGKVEDITVLHTILKTPDNKTIILPNGPLSSSSLTNYSTEKNRRIDWTFGIGYQDDIDQARKVLQELIAADSRIFTDPAPQIVVSELADSSVNFAVRVWSEGAHYWDIYFEMQESVKKTFDNKGISIPFPQREVHLVKADSSAN
jgi:small conductance mechanosensitive channel